MNNILEFLDIESKKVIKFPLLKEVIQLLKRYRINKYEINDNIFRFKAGIYMVVVVEYDIIENYYYVNENNQDVSFAANPKDLISDLENIIKDNRYPVFELPNIKVLYPELTAKDMVKR